MPLRYGPNCSAWAPTNAKAIRWLIALMALYYDPLAIAFDSRGVGVAINH
jgi:hypothetical protein